MYEPGAEDLKEKGPDPTLYICIYLYIYLFTFYNDLL